MRLTKKVLLGLGGAALAYEAYALMNRERDDTISEEVWRSLPRRPLVPFILGALVGHFVWQSQDVYDKILAGEDE